MFTFSSDIEFVPSVSNKILGSAPKQTNKQKTFFLVKKGTFSKRDLLSWL